VVAGASAGACCGAENPGRGMEEGFDI
jgi:hypothetical protein